MADITRLGLERHVVVEFELYGCTVLPPPGLATRLRDAVVCVAREKTGIETDGDRAEGYGDLQAPLGRGFFYSPLLFEEVVFEGALMHVTSLTLITYLLGSSASSASRA